MKKKRRLIIFVIIFIVCIIAALGFVFRDKYDKKIKLIKTEYIYELGDEISANISNYAQFPSKYQQEIKLNCSNLTAKDGYLLKNDSKVIPAGKYECKIELKKENYKFLINVKDTISPEFIKYENTIELEQTTDQVDLLSYFEVKDYNEVSLKINGNYDLNKVGKYDLVVIATDKSENSSKVNFVLNIKEKPNSNTKTNSQKSSNNSNTNTNNHKSSESSNNSANNIQQSFTGYRKDISNSYVNQVNQYRKSKGLSELPVTSETQNEADRRSKELVTNYSHDGVGYAFGEVIGHGTSGGDFITAWKNSPTHNATMLREENTAIAASVYEVDGHWYTVISFKMNY